MFRGKARVFEGEQSLLDALDKTPERFQNHDIVIVRYEGPKRRTGHAGNARSHLAHHHAVP